MQMHDNHVNELDFSDTFNSIRKDLSLYFMAVKIPELYWCVPASCAFHPILTFGSQVISSQEGFQPGDPFSSLGFDDFYYYYHYFSFLVQSSRLNIIIIIIVIIIIIIIIIITKIYIVHMM